MNKNNINIKNLIRAISVIVIGLFFAPTFLVSCAGQTAKISMKTMMVGTSYMGEKVIPPHPILIVLLLIPIAILVLWLILKKIKLDIKKIALLSMICTVIDFILWIIVKGNVVKEASENQFESSATSWFYINQILLLLLFIITLGIYLGKVEAETPIVDAAAKFKSMKDIKKDGMITNSADEPDKDGYCINCGAVIYKGNQFCIKCGTKVERDE